VLQQRAAGEAALHEPPHVCLLMHVGTAQARTRLQELQFVSIVEQVREMHAARASYDALLPNLVSVRISGEDALCGVRSGMRWPARLHEHTTPTHMHQYTYWSLLLYSVLL
jgi:hypothetical protein